MALKDDDKNLGEKFMRIPGPTGPGCCIMVSFNINDVEFQ
jgi:hypothetical protein